MASTLFVADENVPDRLLFEQNVINRQHGTARIAEHILDTVIDQGLQHHLGAGHLPRFHLALSSHSQH